MQDFGLSTRRFYPTILGADVVTPLQLVTAYARIANVGLKVEPQYIESILSSDDELLYQNPNTRPQRIQSVDDVSIFQVKHLLRGVLQTGTAQEIDYLSPYAAGKTGTSN